MRVALSLDELPCCGSSSSGTIPIPIGTIDAPEEVAIPEPSTPKSGRTQIVYEWDGNLPDPI
jgi:hypothetical protein